MSNLIHQRRHRAHAPEAKRATPAFGEHMLNRTSGLHRRNRAQRAAWRELSQPRPVICLIIAMLAFSCAASADSFSAVDDFSLAANPNGVWTYDYTNTLLPNAVTGTGALTGFNYWWDGQSEPNSSIVGENVSGSPITYETTLVLPTDYLVLDPEGNSDVEVLFTAPTAGNYSITGNFLGVDGLENEHPVEILDNGISIFTDTISSVNQSDPFSLNETLNAGDTIGFDVDTGSVYYNLSTGLSATITSSAPEPGTLWIAGIGLAGLLLRRR